MRRALVVLLLASALAAGCGKRDERVVQVSRIAVADGPSASVKSANRGPSPLPPELRAATAEGLVGFDEEGRVVPALADRWIVTDDGQSYIFRLRDGDWPDGKPITGETGAAALRQAIKGLRGSPLALDLAPIDEIRSMAARVVEIRLASPLPELLTLLAQPELALLRRGQGTGPMTLARFGPMYQLEPVSPDKRGLPAVEGWKRRARVVRVQVNPPARAVERFDDGEADVVLGGRADSLPLVKTAGISRGNVQLDPIVGLFGLVFEHQDGFFGDPGNREALAMAIDRAALLAPFNVAGWQPTTRIVPADAEGAPTTVGERWSGQSPEQRRQAASARVVRWKAGGRGIAPLRIALPATPGGTFIYDRLRADFDAIGVPSRRVGEGETADLRLFDRVARYGRAEWFLDELSCAARRPVCSADGDAMLTAAHGATDPKLRAELLADAEARVTAANGFIPFARPLRWSLVRADILGFDTNSLAVHPLLPLAVATR